MYIYIYVLCIYFLFQVTKAFFHIEPSPDLGSSIPGSPPEENGGIAAGNSSKRFELEIPKLGNSRESKFRFSDSAEAFAAFRASETFREKRKLWKHVHVVRKCAKRETF